MNLPTEVKDPLLNVLLSLPEVQVVIQKELGILVASAIYHRLECHWPDGRVAKGKLAEALNGD